MEYFSRLALRQVDPRPRLRPRIRSSYERWPDDQAEGALIEEIVAPGPAGTVTLDALPRRSSEPPSGDPVASSSVGATAGVGAGTAEDGRNLGAVARHPSRPREGRPSAAAFSASRSAGDDDADTGATPGTPRRPAARAARHEMAPTLVPNPLERPRATPNRADVPGSPSDGLARVKPLVPQRASGVAVSRSLDLDGPRRGPSEARATALAGPIEVHIGRIDVRAADPPAASPPARRASRQPALSLDAYLNERHGAARP